MPELPEVETVRRGLAPAMEGGVFQSVRLARPDLRFPLPDKFAQRLEGATLLSLQRRGKYLLAPLSSDETLIMHLGMTGRFTVYQDGAEESAPQKGGGAKRGKDHKGDQDGKGGDKGTQPGRFLYDAGGADKHDHVVFWMTPGPGLAPDGSGRGKTLGKMRPAHKSNRGVTVTYNDARRFGFMDLVPSAQIDQCKHFKAMGPEPLSDGFDGAALSEALKGRATPIKSALLDQRIVAGLGNIYVCEALYRAQISPRRKAASVSGARALRLAPIIKQVLHEAIEAGGSTLRDFAAADGALGYFQHGFEVYGREGAACGRCGAPIKRLEQAGRSTFFCSACQR